ncbi:hypothetical protein ACH5RR_036628 [Cinchona calisaya]|uniref:Uncharacterized protein n=1 Tax=Cinchona calisaya TaxID=153742 RepID=A0ABD2Y7D6_9GENT
MGHVQEVGKSQNKKRLAKSLVDEELSDAEPVKKKSEMHPSLINDIPTDSTVLECCRVGLLQWSKEVFGDLRRMVESTRKQIEVLYSEETMNNVKAHLGERETQLEGILDEEEMMWKQRSKQHWYKNGYRNTQFFMPKLRNDRKLTL